MELRQTWTRPGRGRYLRHQLWRLLLFWLLPALVVVVSAYVVARRG